MNPLGNITKEVMVEALHIKGISTLQKVYDNLYTPCKRTLESNKYSWSSADSLVVAHTVFGSVRTTLARDVVGQVRCEHSWHCSWLPYV